VWLPFLAILLICRPAQSVGCGCNNKQQEQEAVFSVMSATSIGSAVQPKNGSNFSKAETLVYLPRPENEPEEPTQPHSTPPNPTHSIAKAIANASAGSGQIVPVSVSESESESANVSAAKPMPKFNVVFPEMR